MTASQMTVFTHQRGCPNEFCPPAHTQRILFARRPVPRHRHGGAGQSLGPAGHRPHRPRHDVWHDAVLPRSQSCRNQPHHWPGGLYLCRADDRAQAPALSPAAAGRKPGRLPELAQTRQPGPTRRLLLPTPRGPRNPGPLQRGPDRHLGLPGRRGPPAAQPGADRQGPGTA